MQKLHSLTFCTLCQSLLNPHSNHTEQCQNCNTRIPDHQNFRIVSKSLPGTYKKPYTSDNFVNPDIVAKATIDEKCPGCGWKEMAFSTAQLRSADEGQTIFYNCVKCGYKYSMNS